MDEYLDLRPTFVAVREMGFEAYVTLQTDRQEMTTGDYVVYSVAVSPAGRVAYYKLPYNMPTGGEFFSPHAKTPRRHLRRSILPSRAQRLHLMRGALACVFEQMERETFEGGKRYRILDECQSVLRREIARHLADNLERPREGGSEPRAILVIVS